MTGKELVAAAGALGPEERLALRRQAQGGDAPAAQLLAVRAMVDKARREKRPLAALADLLDQAEMRVEYA